MTSVPGDGDFCSNPTCGADLREQAEWLKTQMNDPPEEGQCQECGHSWRRYERTIND